MCLLHPQMWSFLAVWIFSSLTVISGLGNREVNPGGKAVCLLTVEEPGHWPVTGHCLLSGWKAGLGPGCFSSRFSQTDMQLILGSRYVLMALTC